MPKLFRGFVLRGIKKDTPEPLRRYSLPIFEKEQEWKRITTFREPNDAYLLVVDQTGEVEWKTHGEFTTKQLQI